LIVLGFLSFMVVSAVAFSLWMRNERAPSSAYRRTVAARHLVKAGLARAIAELDFAIKDDPFPGVVNSGSPGPMFADSDSNGYYDYWRGRVFFPPNPNKAAGQNTRSGTANDTESRTATLKDTVSVLTLEGLGYIPAPLVNDVRFHSRESWAAAWKNFDYDCGRYAYCAVNVSDFLDMNRVAAAVPRMGTKDYRISAAYLFADKEQTKYGVANDSDAKAFDDFVAAQRGGELSNIPFTSLLDFNLALGDESVGNVLSPFYQLAKGSPLDQFYGNDTNYIMRQLFVTDSWYPATNRQDQASLIDLAEEKNQPFLPSAYGQRGYDVIEQKSVGGKAFNDVLSEAMPEAGRAALYDYLDEDNVPLALAIPSAERIPMITSLKCEPMLSTMNISMTDSPTWQEVLKTPKGDDGTPTTTEIEIKTTVKARVSVKAELMEGLCFPFRAIDDEDDFNVEGMGRFFLVKDEPNLDLKAMTRLKGRGKNAIAPDRDVWKSTSITKPSEGVLTGKAEAKKITLPEAVEDEDILINSQAPIDLVVQEFDVATYTRKAKWNKSSNTWEDTDTPTPEGNTLKWSIYNTSSLSDGAVATPSDIATEANAYRPCLAIAARVRNSDGDTVDMVPAGAKDDDVNNITSKFLEGPLAKPVTGANNPVIVLPFAATVNFALTNERRNALHSAADGKILGSGEGAGAALGLYCKLDQFLDDKNGLMCGDPRFNYAPEDWYWHSNPSAEAWLENNKSLFSAEGRNSDPFFASNDTEWLYSPGELAFIPRLADIDNTDFVNKGYSDGIKNNIGETANYAFFWKGYRLFDGALSSDRLFDLDLIDDDGTGPHANPYSDMPLLLAAAFANTPVSFAVASTNNLADNVKVSDVPAFNDVNNDLSARIYRSEIDEIARVFHRDLIANDNARRGDWLAAYDDIWDNYSKTDASDELFGVRLKDAVLHDSDRKFLYMLWRNSFANRQQLFLIFVRAESAVLGGAAENTTPAQLGARAVALVWRDPAPPEGTNGNSGENDNRIPHRTRILFYHQFD
ncbi:MAG: hypothetical protein IJ802_03485, partial [Kiritimatiellae bacterium]|nr:hypothetical protein [Kiritimatiellia bacterium]